MTLETVVDSLNSDEIGDLCFCLNNFSEPSTGVYANKTNLQFYRLKYSKECVERALNSDNINAQGAFYIQQLQMKLEKF